MQSRTPPAPPRRIRMKPAAIRGLSLLLWVVGSGAACESGKPTAKHEKTRSSASIGRTGANSPHAIARPLANVPFVKRNRNVLEYELMPSYSGNFAWAPFETNRWGMRDRDYELEHPAGTYRIALLGSAFAMGAGVPEPETFQAVAEALLNDRPAPGRSPKYEILNFGVNGYTLIENVTVLDQKVWQFKPDAVLLVMEPAEPRKIGARIVLLTEDSIHIPYPEVNEFIKQAGVSPSMSQIQMSARMRSTAPIVRWGLSKFKGDCVGRGVLPLVLVIPNPTANGNGINKVNRLSDAAQAAGLTVLHAEDVFDSVAGDSLSLTKTPSLANSRAHKLLGTALAKELRTALAAIPAKPNGRGGKF